LAQMHQAQTQGDQDDVAQALNAQNQGIAGKAQEGRFPELQEPHLILSSPAGIESTTPQTTHQHSGQHHAISSGGHTSVSAGKSLLASAAEAVRLFAYRAGIKLISAREDIDIRALRANLHALAKLKITMTAERIEIQGAQEVLINGGGSYTRWTASGIDSGTTGSHVMHAASHDFSEARSMAPVTLPMPTAKPWMELRYTYPDKKPVAGAPYKLVFANGEVRQGELDDQGFARLEDVPDAQAFVEYGEDRRDAVPRRETEPNAVLGMRVTDAASAKVVLDRYLAQEDEYLLDNYFPDEIDAVLNPDAYDTQQFWRDYSYTNEIDADQQRDYASKHAGTPPGDDT
ncbi:MAG: DUF2345 domain-containing protein, partial [Aquincola sp.]|nr:DUF2345 domain-containing protein [Aquincola sp.]